MPEASDLNLNVAPTPQGNLIARFQDEIHSESTARAL